MEPSEYQLKRIEEKKEKTILLYKTGLSTRDVSRLVGRSHAWVAYTIRERLYGLPRYSTIAHREDICKICKKSFKNNVKNNKRYSCDECLQSISFIKGGRDRNRELVRMRDNHTCQDCGEKWDGKGKKFDVHHLKGLCGRLSRGYDKQKTIDDLITLCHRCHFNRPDHSRKKQGVDNSG